MRAYKKYIIVHRPSEPEATSSGIILTNNDANHDVVKASVHHCVNGQLDGIKIGDEVHVVRRHAMRLEADNELYAIEPEHVAALPDK